MACLGGSFFGAAGFGYLSRDEFDRVISEALESLPTRFGNLVENVVILAEDEPTDDDLESLEGGGGFRSELLGASTVASHSPNGRTK